LTIFQVGQTASCSKTITEADIVLFAGVSGDFNPIHIDVEYANKTRFKGRIAHGLLTSTLLSQLLGMHLPGKGSVYLEQTLKFKAPVMIGDTITASAIVEKYDEEKCILQLATHCHNQIGTLVLTGVAKMLVPKEGDQI